MSADRPNFLVLLTDQQHANLLGCEGDAYVHTPNLDRLAASGMRFRRTYTTNPVCVPCRYSFVSGGAIPHALPGRSLKPLLLGETPDGWRDHVVAETIHGRMVRTDRWKYELLYVADANVSGEMLIDMERDPGETVNLAPDPAHRGTLARHRARLRDNVNRNGDAAGQRYLAALPAQ